MDICPIRTQDDYQAALREVSAYFDNEPVPGTEEGDRFEILMTLVEAFEARHFPVDLPDPIEAGLIGDRPHFHFPFICHPPAAAWACGRACHARCGGPAARRPAAGSGPCLAPARCG